LIRFPSSTILALTALVGAPPVFAQSLEVDKVRIKEVDRGFTFTNPSFGVMPNFSSATQDALVSYGGWQYLAYWDHDRRLAVARRQLPTQGWEIMRFEDYRGLTEDAHNSVNLGICPADGTLHLAFDHHVDDLNYRVSIAGLAEFPELHAWDVSLFGPVIDTLIPADGKMTQVTYPRFLATPDGDMQFVYREVSSGNGRSRIVDYDAQSGLWSNNRTWIELGDGVHDDPLGGTSTSRNPYLNRIEYDDQGVLHATWTWRERAPIRYNRDIAYAYSLDQGLTWLNNDSLLVADTTIGGSISIQSPQINVVELGAEWGLMNSQAQVVDGQGRVHVVMYYKEQPDTEVSYGNSTNSKYVHYWRDLSGVWSTQTLPTIGDRPKLIVDDADNLILVYRAGRSLRVEAAHAAAQWSDWAVIYSLDANLGSSIAVDAAGVSSEQTFSLSAQQFPAFPGKDTRIGVVDFRLKD